MAITRNASESLEIAQCGIDLKPGDEVLTTNQDYPRMLTTFRQRERREGIVLKTISFPVPPPSLDDLYQRFERAVTPKTKLILVCHITNRTGVIFPDQANLRDGPRAQHPGDRRRRPRVQPLPVFDFRSRLRLLRNQPPQVGLRSHWNGVPVRAEIAHRRHLAADGRRGAPG
jgi:hypothetical protein